MSRKIYKIKIEKEPADFIRNQTKKIQRQILNKITALATDPCGRGERIKSTANIFKIRAGRYRIAYVVEEDRVLILVIRIGHRRDFYRYFGR